MEIPNPCRGGGRALGWPAPESRSKCTDTGNIGKRSFLGQPGANFENILREVLDRSVSEPGGLC